MAAALGEAGSGCPFLCLSWWAFLRVGEASIRVADAGMPTAPVFWASKKGKVGRYRRRWSVWVKKWGAWEQKWSKGQGGGGGYWRRVPWSPGGAGPASSTPAFKPKSS